MFNVTFKLGTRFVQATFQATVGNAEIQNIIQILGLDLGQNLKGSAIASAALESIVIHCAKLRMLRLLSARSCANPEHDVPAGSMCSLKLLRRHDCANTRCHHGQSESIDPSHFWWPEIGGIPPLTFQTPQLVHRMDVRSQIDQPSCMSSAVQLRFRFGAAESL